MSISLVARSTIEFTISDHRRRKFKTELDRLFSDDCRPNHRCDRRKIPAMNLEDCGSFVIPLEERFGVRIGNFEGKEQRSYCNKNVPRVVTDAVGF